MAKRKPCWFMLDLDLVDRLESTKARTGLPVAEQIRRSIRYWLESQEWTVGRKRPHPRVDVID
jgi:hypothetical protein